MIEARAGQNKSESKSQSKSQSNLMKTALKALFVVALLYFMAKKGFISIHDTQRAFTQWQYILPAFGATVLCSFLGVIRWQVLLRAQGLHLSFLRVFQLNFIGNFFNIALPGAVSGDFVKAFYVGREIEGKRARAFGSILFDRLAGVSALVLLSAISLGIGYRGFAGTKLLGAIQVLMTLGAIGVVVFYGYLFLVREQHDPLLILLKRLQSRFDKAAPVTRIYEGLRHYHHHRPSVLFVLVLSVIIHMIVGWSCLQLAYALGETQLDLLSLYVVVPLGLLVTAVPVMPGGVGTGHVAFTYFFALIGSSRGADVFTLYVLQQFVIGGLGGLVYLQFRGHEPTPDFSSA